MMVDTHGALIAALDVAGSGEEVGARAHDVGQREILQQLFRNGVPTRLRNHVIWKRTVVVQRVPNGFAGSGEVAGQHLLGRNQALQDNTLALPPAFVVDKEEGLVAPDGTAEIGAELIISETWGTVAGAEKLAGIEGTISNKVIRYAVKGVGAALGDEFDAGRAVTVGCVHEVDLYFELLQRIEGKRNGRIVDVGNCKVRAVESCQGRCIANASDLDRTSVHHAAAARYFGRSWCQRNEVEEVAGVQRQFMNSTSINGGTERSGIRLKNRSDGLHVDGLRHRPDLHREIHSGLSIDGYDNIRNVRDFE